MNELFGQMLDRKSVTTIGGPWLCGPNATNFFLVSELISKNSANGRAAVSHRAVSLEPTEVRSRFSVKLTLIGVHSR
jgi:hypothetical protein